MNNFCMTTWAPELMFAKLFELLGKENGVFFGTLSRLQWHANSSSSASFGSAFPQLCAGPGSPRRQPHRSHGLRPATSSPAAQMGTPFRKKGEGQHELGSGVETRRDLWLRFTS
ncbi:unnamed protein product [Rangifer tarandus platyrhynchus]|uniref:Uncharacterized protein n=2 Tax=Rangifer tarandus platyrhynchus TaxID=3082113 RepID=A0ABN8Y816_RANTA|nr:unnamed protein product [Rangifer tarandus platyrhynchus]